MFREYKAWHYFIYTKLLPNSNISEVTKEQELLNYAIQRSISDDVDMVIQTNFLRALRGSTIVYLGYHSLIYALCTKRRIVTSPVENIVYPKPALTRTIVWQLSSKQLFANAPPQDIDAQSSCPHRPLPISCYTNDDVG